MAYSVLAKAFKRNKADKGTPRQQAAARSQELRARLSERQKIRARIRADERRGFIPTGTLVSADEVEPWDAVGSTGVSTIDSEQVGDPLGQEDVDAFLRGEMAIMASSSNVRYLKYDPENEQLEVGFLAHGNWPESAYKYAPVSREEALVAATASSKGSYVWDELRVRGTVFQHKKAYWRVY